MIDTEATREVEQRTFEGDKQAAVKIADVDVVSQLLTTTTTKRPPIFAVLVIGTSSRL
jgi:hypothetical protein